MTLMSMKTRLPPWLRVRLDTDGKYARVHALLHEQRLHTVCESAQCPNRQECFRRGTATIMILGNVCTRNCAFCAVTSGKPQAVDPDEPRRAAALVKNLKLRHAVITSVTRDDLPDGGAGVFAETISAIGAAMNGRTTVEVLTPDFNGAEKALAVVLEAKPDVFNHNLETVERLQKETRPQAGYRRSLEVLKRAAMSGKARTVKSGLMAGLGESDAELYEAMRDLLQHGCQCLTLGQYLAPSRSHRPVKRFVPPETFEEYRQHALRMGFRAVAAGPLVRSSYLAEHLFNDAIAPRRPH